MTAKKQRSLCSKITKISISENGENKRFHTNSIYLFNAPHTISENCWVPSHWTSKIMFFKVIQIDEQLKLFPYRKKKKTIILKRWRAELLLTITDKWVNGWWVDGRWKDRPNIHTHQIILWLLITWNISIYAIQKESCIYFLMLPLLT